jgi:hypothetical protein
VTVSRQCRNCATPTRRLEVAGGGGGELFLPFTPKFESGVGEDFSYDGNEPRWLCRFLDAHACPTCGTCDLAPQDVATYLRCDGPHLPRSPLNCPACGSWCLGPIAVECFGVPGSPLAYLAPKYGAPLLGRLCEGCGLTWLSLDPEDREARRELAKRFSGEAACGRCRQGQLRMTRVDVPYSDLAGLYDPASHAGHLGEAGLLADLFVAVCDSCGEAETRAKWREHKTAEKGAAPDPARV